MNQKDYISHLEFELKQEKKHLLELDEKELELHNPEERKKISEKRNSVISKIRALEEAITKEKMEILAKEDPYSPELVEYKFEQDRKRNKKRAETFERLKAEYKKKSIFQRAAVALSGKKPNWKKISGYTLEQLEYLERVSKGLTSSQIDSNRKYLSGLSDKQRKKERLRMNWEEFIYQVNHPEKYLQTEELKKRGM